MRTERAAWSAAAAFLLALLFALPIAHDLLRMPVQVSDALDEMIDARRSPSAAASFREALDDRAHLRPLRVAQTKWVLDLSGGGYRAGFRGFHAVLLVILVMLFTSLVAVRIGAGVSVTLFGLTALTGLHTFEGMIREAYPINHFIEIAVCGLIALSLVLARPAWWIDLAAVAISAVAMLTLESGVLVWVVIATAWLCGLRGVSTRCTAAVTAMLAVYLVAWTMQRGDEMPLFDGRSAGYWFAVLDPDELALRFGDRPWLFYLYNVTASLGSVLFGQPQDGWFGRPGQWLTPKPYLPLISNTVTTGVIVWAAVRLHRSDAWRRGDRTLRLLAIAAAVIAASAILSFNYTKDDTLSTAGVFYAIAACLAVRHAAASVVPRTGARAVLLAAVLLIASVAWTVQAAGVHYTLSGHAFRTRNDWARLPGIWSRQGRWPEEEADRRLVWQLRQDALMTPGANPRLAPRWMALVWGD